MATEEQPQLVMDLAPRITASERARADQLIHGLAERSWRVPPPDPGEHGVKAEAWRDTCREVAGNALLAGLQAMTNGEATAGGDDPLTRAGLLSEFVDAAIGAYGHLQRARTDSPNVADAKAALERAVALARNEARKSPKQHRGHLRLTLAAAEERHRPPLPCRV